ncbi:hypothetical protein [Nocardia sp. NPDC006630]|uniref:hypothetical protein n=1 Tax=Nocardia sp. NPDC006630 TaxID=3157181 RepID=UPI0033AE75A4
MGVLVVEAMAHHFPPEQVRAELATTMTHTVVRFGPDAATIDIFNAFVSNPDVLASWPLAFRAGIRQAEVLAQRLIDAGWSSPMR